MVSSFKKIKANKFKCDLCIKLKEEERSHNSSSNNSSSSNSNNSSTEDSKDKTSEDTHDIQSPQQQQQHHHQQQQQNLSSTDDDDDENSIVIAKCLDCNVNLCSNCLLEHQIINLDLNHKLVSLINKTHQSSDVNTSGKAFGEKSGGGDFFSTSNDKNKHKQHCKWSEYKIFSIYSQANLFLVVLNESIN